MLEIACIVEPGVRFPKNDDRAAINSKLISRGAYSETTEESCLAVVCDGVGGEAFGNEAADIVTDIFSRISGMQLTIDLIKEYIIKANEAVRNSQKTDVKHSRMATTIAGLYINGDNFLAFNIGDSRIYRFRSYLSQISKDHSVWQEQIDSGLDPTPSQGNIITRYIGGIQAIPEIIDGVGRVFYNDVYILCTDGVWGVLGDSDFEKILSHAGKLKDVCKSFIDLALQKGSKDNLSIIIIRSV